MANSEQHRRTRIEAGVAPQLREWLHRVTRCHAHLLYIVRLYGNPSKAGGQSNEGETYQARAARGDRTLLYDALTLTRDELDDIRELVQREMDAAAPTDHEPGSPGKVAEMAARADRGESLFIQGDRT